VEVLTDIGFLVNPVKQNLNMETRLVALGFLLKRVTKFLETAGEVRAHHQNVTASPKSRARSLPARSPTDSRANSDPATTPVV